MKTTFASLAVFIGLTITFLILCVWCIQGLWNTTVPEIFNLKEISFLQALRLMLLVQLILGTQTYLSSKKGN